MTGEAREQLRNATRRAPADANGDSPTSYVQNGAYKTPGRLADPKMVLKDDPRINPKLLTLFEALGMAAFGSVPTLSKVNEK